MLSVTSGAIRARTKQAGCCASSLRDGEWADGASGRDEALVGIRTRLRASASLVVLVVAMATLLVLIVVVVPSRLAGEGDTENQVRTTLLQGLAGVALAVGLYFTGRTYLLNREGQITERFTRAIDQLGHEKLDIRLGGIYALERIARSSADDHGPIMEVLTAFVRGHAPWPPPPAKQEPARAHRPRTDVQAVIAVLGRRERGRKEHVLHLSSVDLRGARFSKAPDEGHFAKANFELANLSKAHLMETNLCNANLAKANLSGADLGGANLSEAWLAEANLSPANHTPANLSAANLSAANLFEAKLLKANLYKANLSEANLSEADLSEASFFGADLSKAILSEAILSGADLSEADLSDAYGLTSTQVASAKVDDKTVLPPGLIQGKRDR